MGIRQRIFFLVSVKIDGREVLADVDLVIILRVIISSDYKKIIKHLFSSREIDGRMVITFPREISIKYGVN